MHVVPLFGFLIAPLPQKRAGKIAVVGFAACYGAFVFYAFGEALAGKPFLTALL
jgi:hypothetical protein